MADVPDSRPTDDTPGLTLFDDEPAAQARDAVPPPGGAADAPADPPAGGLRETILRFLEVEL